MSDGCCKPGPEGPSDPLEIANVAGGIRSKLDDRVPKRPNKLFFQAGAHRVCSCSWRIGRRWRRKWQGVSHHELLVFFRAENLSQYMVSFVSGELYCDGVNSTRKSGQAAGSSDSIVQAFEFCFRIKQRKNEKRTWVRLLISLVLCDNLRTTRKKSVFHTAHIQHSIAQRNIA